MRSSRRCASDGLPAAAARCGASSGGTISASKKTLYAGGAEARGRGPHPAALDAERVAWQSMCATDEGMLKGEQWCRKCIWGNLLPEWKHAFGSVEKIQSGDFVSLWTARIDHFANRFSVAQDGASTQTSARSQARHPTTVAHGNLRTSQPHARHRVAAADRKLSVPATAQQLKGSRIALARTRSGHAKAAKRATAS